jgi:hypothetical protein
MSTKKHLLALTASLAVTAPALVFVTQVEASAVPAQWANCTTVNNRLPHGVGRATARDRTSGTPVTTFRRDTRMYDLAMSLNSRLDGDKDGIACEKR